MINITQILAVLQVAVALLKGAAGATPAQQLVALSYSEKAVAMVQEYQASLPSSSPATQGTDSASMPAVGAASSQATASSTSSSTPSASSSPSFIQPSSNDAYPGYQQITVAPSATIYVNPSTNSAVTVTYGPSATTTATSTVFDNFTIVCPAPFTVGQTIMPSDHPEWFSPLGVVSPDLSPLQKEHLSVWERYCNLYPTTISAVDYVLGITTSSTDPANFTSGPNPGSPWTTAWTANVSSTQ